MRCRAPGWSGSDGIFSRSAANDSQGAGAVVLSLIKAHAYGNDFLYVPQSEVQDVDLLALARLLCDRHRGAGADGLILYDLTPDGARMRLINADGTPAEISGNGLRALAAIVIRQ